MRIIINKVESKMQKLTKKTKVELTDIMDDLIFYKGFAKEHMEKGNMERYTYWQRMFYAALIRLHNDYGLLPWAESIEEARANYEMYDRAYEINIANSL